MPAPNRLRLEMDGSGRGKQEEGGRKVGNAGSSEQWGTLVMWVATSKDNRKLPVPAWTTRGEIVEPAMHELFTARKTQ